MGIDIRRDIGDDEIRIISSSQEIKTDISCHGYISNDCDTANAKTQKCEEVPEKNSGRAKWIIIAACVIVAALIAWIIADAVSQADDDPVTVTEVVTAETVNEEQPQDMVADTVAVAARSFVETIDTVVGDAPLMIISAVNAEPRLHIGTDALADTAAVLVVQAADVRGDNGAIVGTYVKEGDLLSRGQSKAGFCAIINGKMTVGVAESTPYMEQTLETGGYFFRQYPLVVANQIVENKLKNRALRKALAELNGKMVVVIGRKKQTMHEFSQTLVDLGVSNAIYLVGSAAYGIARDGDGNLIEFGTSADNAPANTNYIVWR